jgi:rhodanese-related sulfurtransferase
VIRPQVFILPVDSSAQNCIRYNLQEQFLLEKLLDKTVVAGSESLHPVDSSGATDNQSGTRSRRKADRLLTNELLERPSLISEKDTVVYCTCPSDKTSRAVLRRAMSLHFLRVKFLNGGLASWKAKGYPVEPYNEVFHLYTPSAVAKSV